LNSFRGATATEFLEWLTPSALSALPAYNSTLSVLLNERGGIIDDTVVTKHAPDAYYVVTNAGRRERDLAWFTEKLGEWNGSERAAKGKVEMEVLEDWGLLALQGWCNALERKRARALSVDLQGRSRRNTSKA
jgi:aminomethyltransferase